MRDQYDLVTVGGGLGGAAIALAMAKHGARVLVLEREEQFRDRVRGEYLQPWGVEEAHRLGIWDSLVDSGALELTWWDVYTDRERVTHRNFPNTTAVKRPGAAFSHPAAQEALIQAANNAGAEVARGTRVTSVTPGDPPQVEYATSAGAATVCAEVAVGADGRESRMRRWGRFTQHSDEDFLVIAGVLLDGVKMETGSAYIWDDPAKGLRALYFPLGAGLARGYLCWPDGRYPRLSGRRDFTTFIEKCIQIGVPVEALNNARQTGPLATFSGADSWVEHPAVDGMALIGDAAATSDPVWGHGVSLTLRDARVLQECLTTISDWNEACNEYATRHARYYGCMHTYESWAGRISFPSGPEGIAAATKATAAQRADPSRRPDLQGSGPDFTLDETAKRRFFGED